MCCDPELVNYLSKNSIIESHIRYIMSSRCSGADLVFGELPSWFELKVLTNLEDAHNLFEHIKKVEQKLLTEYISLIMARTGYSNITVRDMYPFESNETIDFTIDDWVTHIDAFNCWEEFRKVETDAMYEMIDRHAQEWSVLFEDVGEEKIVINIITSDPSWLFMNLIGTGEVKTVFEDFIYSLDKTRRNYVVVHPNAYQKDKNVYQKFGDKVTEALGYQAFFTIEGFLHFMIPDDTKKKVIKEDWIEIRENIYSNIRSEYPFLYRAAHSKRIDRIRELVQNAESKFAFDYRGNYRDVIAESAIACEHILLVLYDIHIKRISDQNRLMLHDLIEQLRPILDEQYTENTYSDLHYIRKWRNPSVHASEIEVDELNTYQVLSRMKLFYKQFMRNMEEMI